MRVLVTGGAGVLGVGVARGLLERGHEVVSVSRRAAPDLLGELAGEVELASGDVRDAERMAQLIAPGKVEVVVHLAAALPATVREDPVAAAEINVLATSSLFEIATRAGVRRFVNASSKSAYGPLPEGEPIGETHPARPLEGYGATKYAAELVLASQARRPGAPEATSLRFASIYGPGKADRHAGAAITSRLVAEAIAGRPVRFESGGDQLDDLIYAEDAAAGILAAALAPGPLSPLYNVSTGVGVTLREFGAAVAEAFPGASIEIGPGRQYMGPDFVYGILDPSLARAELGFAASADHGAGARRFAEALA